MHDFFDDFLCPIRRSRVDNYPVVDDFFTDVSKSRIALLSFLTIIFRQIVFIISLTPYYFIKNLLLKNKYLLSTF